MLNLLKKIGVALKMTFVYTVAGVVLFLALPFITLLVSVRASLSKNWDTMSHDSKVKMTELNLRIKEAMQIIPNVKYEEGE